MMRTVFIEIEGFRAWKNPVRFELDRGLTFFCGDNASGKSSALNAVEWCLFGDEVTKKNCGIDERASWSVRTRNNGDRPARVVLGLTDGENEYRLERVRVRDKGDDQLMVHVPGAKALVGDDGYDWCQKMGIPDWDEYRRAHCQHQETARVRLLDKNDRKAALVYLLGLGDDLELGAALKVGKGLPKKLEKNTEEIENRIEAALLRPLADIRDLEDRIANQGLPRNAIGPDSATELSAKMLDRATHLAKKIAAPFSDLDAGDTVAFIAWAENWPAIARDSTGLDQKRGHNRKAKAALESALASLEPLHDAKRNAQKRLAEAITADGDMANRKRLLDQAQQHLEQAEAARRDTNRLASLLEDALKVMETSGELGTCPVCKSNVSKLKDNIAERLTNHEGEAFDTFHQAVNDARKQASDLQKAIDDLKALEQSASDTNNRFEGALGTLCGLLDVTAPDEGQDVMAMARRKIEELSSLLNELTQLLDMTDEYLRDHNKDLDLLRNLEKLAEAKVRAANRCDVTALPEWATLQDGIDRAAGFATDLDALSTMLRQIQERRSNERLSQVNRTLAGHIEAICGDHVPIGLVVNVRTTPETLEYQLLDLDGQDVLPVLNQGAMNAISLAILFSLAQESVRNGQLSTVVLDDPVQSLDPAMQRGLADALEQLCKSCCVLVGVTESPLLERSRKYIAAPCTYYNLVKAGDEGASIQEEERP